MLIIKELHEKLDVAVAEVYGWPIDLSDDEILARLVALNRSARRKSGAAWCAGSGRIIRFAASVRIWTSRPRRKKARRCAAELALPATEQKSAFPEALWSRPRRCLLCSRQRAGDDHAATITGEGVLRKRAQPQEAGRLGEVLAFFARLGPRDVNRRTTFCKLA